MSRSPALLATRSLMRRKMGYTNSHRRLIVGAVAAVADVPQQPTVARAATTRRTRLSPVRAAPHSLGCWARRGNPVLGRPMAARSAGRAVRDRAALGPPEGSHLPAPSPGAQADVRPHP